MSAHQTDSPLTDRVALITGGAADVGRASALLLARLGAAVAVNDVNPDGIDRVVEAIVTAGGRAVEIHGDISNRFQAASAIERTRDAFGRIDILVNAAAVYRADPLERIDEWDWRRVLDVNVTGTFFCLQLAARVMADEGGGVIINLVSDVVERGAVSYVTARYAVLGLTRAAALELAPRGVRVAAVEVPVFSGEDDPRIAPTADAIARLAQSGTPGEVVRP
jgi:NAD(P)-dependent dehydrogenase (short-subunit alcohol dehydrogenase family)